jgi:hypothetical protein
MGLFTNRFPEFRELDKLYPTGLDNDLDALKTFLKFTQNGTTENLKKDIKEMEEEMKNDIVKDSVVLHSNVDYLDYMSSSNALNLIYNSMLISLCSFLETRLGLLCKLIENRETESLKNIIGTSTLVKFKNYLSEVHSIDFNSINSEWEQIFAYAYLRNKLVHNHSPKINIKTNPDGYSELKKIKFLYLDDKSEINKIYINDPRILEEYFDLISRILNFIVTIKVDYKDLIKN